MDKNRFKVLSERYGKSVSLAALGLFFLGTKQLVSSSLVKLSESSGNGYLNNFINVWNSFPEDKRKIFEFWMPALLFLVVIPALGLIKSNKR